jgi:RNA polymerase sigma-70 factor (ECF subfamily)
MSEPAHTRLRGRVSAARLGKSAEPEQPAGTLSAEDRALLDGLRNRDEKAFAELVERYHGRLLRLARLYVPSRAVAEETVQETWLGVLQGIDRFEGRCSLKTWLFKILTNRARTRGVREARSVAVGLACDMEAGASEPAVPSDRFRGPNDRWPDHWKTPPRPWGPNPERALLSAETKKLLEAAIQALPPAQREVITLRDVEHCTAEEVCNAMGISETNQRVLLHRARSRVRRALEQHFEGGPH